MDKLRGGYSGHFTELLIRDFESDYEGMTRNTIRLIHAIKQEDSNNYTKVLGLVLNRYIPEYKLRCNNFMHKYEKLFADPSINSAMTKLQERRTELDRVIAVAQDHLFRSSSFSKSGAEGSLLGNLVLDFELEVYRLCGGIDLKTQEIKIVPGRINQKTLTSILDEASSWIITECEQFYHTFKGLFSDPEKIGQFESIEQKKSKFFHTAGETRLWLEAIDLIPSPQDPSSSIFGSSEDLSRLASLPSQRPRLCTMDDGDEGSSPLGSPPASSPPSSFKESPKIRNQQTETLKNGCPDSFLRKGPEFKDIVLEELGKALARIPEGGELTPSQISEFQRVFSSDLYVEYTYHVRPGATTSLREKINNAYHWAGQ